MKKPGPYTRQGKIIHKDGVPVGEAVDETAAERLEGELNSLHVRLKDLTQAVKDHWYEQSLPGKSKDLLRHYRERVGECLRKVE